MLWLLHEVHEMAPAINDQIRSGNIYENVCSDIELLLKQFSTSVSSSADNNSSQWGQLPSPGETILCYVPATGELGQEPGQKGEYLAYWIWF